MSSATPGELTKGIGEHVPCLQCGYDLHRQAEDAACPECGLAIERSLAGDALERADRAWLRGVQRGLRGTYRALRLLAWLAVAAVLTAVLTIFVGFAVVPFLAAPPDWLAGVVEAGFSIFLVIIPLTLLIVPPWLAVNTWRILRAEPDRGETAPRRVLRQAGRWCGVTLGAAPAVAMMFEGWMGAMAVLKPTMLVLVVVWTAAVVVQLEDFARRLRSTTLVASARRLRRTGVTLLVLLAVLWVGRRSALFPPPGAAPPGVPAYQIVLMMIGGFLPLVLLAYTVQSALNLAKLADGVRRELEARGPGESGGLRPPASGGVGG